MEKLYEITRKYLPNSKGGNTEAGQDMWGENTRKVFRADEFYVPDNRDHVIFVHDEDTWEEIILNEKEIDERSRLLLFEATDATDAATRKKAVEFRNKIGISGSLYSQVVNRKKLVSRNLALNCIFEFELLPTIAEANHILTELRQPGLFTNTSESGNRRNYLIACVLGWANVTQRGEKRINILPQNTGWLGFLQMILREAQVEGTTGPSANMKIPELTDCSSEVRELIQYLQDNAKTITPNANNSLRKSLANNYKEEKGLPSVTELCYECMKSGAYVSDIDHIRKILTGGERGGRDTLIYLFSYLGCSLVEMNQILQQADYPLLYPRSRIEEEQEFLRLFSTN